MLGTNMCRITFSGPELADYPCESNGVPFKLLLPRSGQAEPQMPEGFENGRPKGRSFFYDTGALQSIYRTPHFSGAESPKMSPAKPTVVMPPI